MLRFDRVPLLLAYLHLVSAKQPSAPSAVSAPLRELPWTGPGGINFLHTTDTHGWHGGHLQEPQYNADWGDYISFAHHLRKRADDDGSDLLVIDTGDRVEGNGLYDASDPPGKYTFDLFKQQHIDIITSGNHELYINTTSQREYDEVVPDFKDSYIASNIDMRSSKDGKSVPLAPRYRKFKTKNQKLNVLAFGFLYDFKGNANNTIVQPIEETVQEQWFKDAIREKDIDLFVVAGHVPVRDTPEFDAVYKAIRDVKWDTPIAFFGGHTHIRDYRKFDKKAYGIESGRYMETVGFMSVSGLGSGGSRGVEATEASAKFERSYVDNNLFSYHHHSATNESNFDTERGKNVSSAIAEIRTILTLDDTFGCAPHDFWLNRAPYPSKDSLLTLLEEHIIPDTFTTSNSSKHPAIVITNSGALRFDIFKGQFTHDSEYLLSPFLSGFRTITNVPYQAASQVLKILNNEGPIPLKDLLAFVEGEPGWDERRLQDILPPLPPVSQLHSSQQRVAERDSLLQNVEQTPLNINLGEGKDDKEAQLPGYTTQDDAGSDGDDTIHQQIQFYTVPNCVGANIGFSASDRDDEPLKNVDIVYNEFIQGWVLLALRYLGVDYGSENTRVALDGKSLTDVIREWVEVHWECDED